MYNLLPLYFSDVKKRIKCAQIEKAITAIEKGITLIQNYKNSLISDVVTGKVDVRHVAVESIEEEPEEELVDEELIESEKVQG